MSILVDRNTTVVVQGITGAQARVDTASCLNYGTRLVAGVTPGRGGELVHGVPVYDTVRRAARAHRIDASVVYVPAPAVKSAVTEAIDAGIRLVLVTAEYVPHHDVVRLAAAAREAGVRLVGCNTNGIISPGQCKLAAVGGSDPDEVYSAGDIGLVSRSGGMTAEIGLALKGAGLGISTSVAMGGDAVTGMKMAEYVLLFQQDPDTRAIVIFGEPGTDNEQEVAQLLRSGAVTKPVVALIVGAFQERYPPGMSFGHAAAMITTGNESASAKRAALAATGARIARTVEDIPGLLQRT